MSHPLYDDAGRADVRRNLARFTVAPLPAGSLKRASVCLIVTDDGAGGCALVLTRRARSLNTHAGQFALPGGRVNEGESTIEAALREAREEINLALDPDTVLGTLDDYPTRSGYLITPIVVWAPQDAEMSASPDEVSRIYHIPVTDLARSGTPVFYSIPESDRPVIQYPIVNSRVHAPTAALIYQFMEVAIGGRDTRVAHLEQPVWAWK